MAKSLPQRFPDAHTTFRLKLWRPHSRVEADGPMAEPTSNLLAILLGYLHPKGKAKAIIEKATADLMALGTRKKKALDKRKKKS